MSKANHSREEDLLPNLSDRAGYGSSSSASVQHRRTSEQLGGHQAMNASTFPHSRPYEQYNETTNPPHEVNITQLRAPSDSEPSSRQDESHRRNLPQSPLRGRSLYGQRPSAPGALRLTALRSRHYTPVGQSLQPSSTSESSAPTISSSTLQPSSTSELPAPSPPCGLSGLDPDLAHRAQAALKTHFGFSALKSFQVRNAICHHLLLYNSL